MATTATKKATANGQSMNDNSAASATKKAAKSSGTGKDKTLEQLLEEGLQDIYSAEQQLIEALPAMAKAAYEEELEHAFNHHLEQTKKHAQRLEKICSRLNIEPTGKTCKAMEGLVAEAKELISEFNESPVRDSGLIIAAQKVEHYEIASYGSLCELADVLGHKKIVEILDRTLREEEDTDHLLTDIAHDINDEAYELSQQQQQGEDEEEEDEDEEWK